MTVRIIASAKRGVHEREGTHSWLPYYAGYSSAFVGDVLGRLSLPTNAVVLDPMNGSGTTTMVAQQTGLLALGADLNPVMAILSRAKSTALVGNDVRVQALVEEVIDSAANDSTNYPVGDEVTAWFSPTVYSALMTLWRGIEASSAGGLPLNPRLEATLLPAWNDPSRGVGDLLWAALLIVARRLARPAGSRNPTWFRPGSPQVMSKHAVFDAFASETRRLMVDLLGAFLPAQLSLSSDSYEAPAQRRDLILHADARELPIRAGVIDAVITSPPYLTRIDYAVTTGPELVLLGYRTRDELHEVRRSIMGSTCIVPGSHDPSPIWGAMCLGIIERVRSHSSKASATYYFKTHVQYFRDAELLLRECLRVLKPGASAFFVVQDSWYKDIHIPLGRIYSEMALLLGAGDVETVNDERIRTHLGLVNTRARRYKKGDVAEQVVQIRKSS